jgi:hypothetical protein
VKDGRWPPVTPSASFNLFRRLSNRQTLGSSPILAIVGLVCETLLVDGKRTVSKIADLLNRRKPPQLIDETFRAFGHLFDQGLD